MKSLFYSPPLLIALTACSPTSSPTETSAPAVIVTAAHRGLMMTTVLDAEAGFLEQHRTSISNPYHSGDLSIVTNSDGSVSARTAFIEDFPGAAPYNPLPASGNATMNGNYKIVSAENIARSGGMTTYTTSTLEGPITVDVNFASGAVTANASDLEVIAKITGTSLKGTASHNGVTGSLTGHAGRDPVLTQDFIFGLFQGADSDQGKAFAGGIKATSDF